MADPTPGAVAYAAYHRAYDAELTWMTPWPQLPPMTRACWEAAAEAAITAWIASPDWPTPQAASEADAADA